MNVPSRDVWSLKLDNALLGSTKAQTKEKNTWLKLKLELEQVWVGFVKYKKELETI